MEVAAGYDLSTSSDYTISSRDKGIVETRLAIALPLGVYTMIAPCLGLAVKHFIDVGVGVIAQDYRGEIKAVLFNHSTEDFQVKTGD